MAPLVAEVFRRRASGETLLGLARWLEREGVLTACRNPGWSAGTVARVLRNRVYLGELRSGEFLNEHAHAPLIDVATFELAQHPRRTTAWGGALPALLRGLVRCASCGLTMNPVTRQRGGRVPRYYVCRGSSAAGRCRAPACVTATLLEPVVEDVVLDLLRRRRRPATRALERAEANLDDMQRALASYRDTRVHCRPTH